MKLICKNTCRSWNGERLTQVKCRERFGRGIDRDDHADTAIAGLCPIGRITSRDRSLCIHGSIGFVCHLWNIAFAFRRSGCNKQFMTLGCCCSVCCARNPGIPAAAMTLALLTGLILIILGILKLGFISNFMSFPVMAGLTTALGLQIATSQLTPILGVPLEGGPF